MRWHPSGRQKLHRVGPAEHTEELRWDQLELLLDWPEQVEYEKIRPFVVFGGSASEHAGETIQWSWEVRYGRSGNQWESTAAR